MTIVPAWKVYAKDAARCGDFIPFHSIPFHVLTPPRPKASPLRFLSMHTGEDRLAGKRLGLDSGGLFFLSSSFSFLFSLPECALFLEAYLPTFFVEDSTGLSGFFLSHPRIIASSRTECGAVLVSIYRRLPRWHFPSLQAWDPPPPLPPGPLPQALSLSLVIFGLHEVKRNREQRQPCFFIRKSEACFPPYSPIACPPPHSLHPAEPFPPSPVLCTPCRLLP